MDIAAAFAIVPLLANLQHLFHGRHSPIRAIKRLGEHVSQ